jgi:tetratricopeptide (TPR) repeat protein
VGESAYYTARSSIHRGALPLAEASLQFAEALDPGMGLYPRQLGTLQLLMDEPESAAASLERAVHINPNDDLTWRLLAFAKRELGDHDGSLVAVARAIQTQRSDPNNLLTLAGMQIDAGRLEDGTATLAEVAQAWPLIVASPGWNESAPPNSTVAILRTARARWASLAPSAVPLDEQPLLLDLMLGRPSTELDPRPGNMTETLRRAYIDVMRCDGDAGMTLAAATDGDRRQEQFWALAIRQAMLQGQAASRLQRMHRIMTGSSSLLGPAYLLLNPLQQYRGGGKDPDELGYQRQPIYWPPALGELPSPDAGRTRWYLDPHAAVAEAGLAHELAGCA